MDQDQATEENSVPSSAGGGASAFERIATLTRRAGHSKS